MKIAWLKHYTGNHERRYRYVHNTGHRQSLLLHDCSLRFGFFSVAPFTPRKISTSACKRYKSYQMLRWEYCSTKQLKNESLFVSTQNEKRAITGTRRREIELWIEYPKFSLSDILNNVLHAPGILLLTHINILMDVCFMIVCLCTKSSHNVFALVVGCLHVQMQRGKNNEDGKRNEAKRKKVKRNT